MRLGLESLPLLLAALFFVTPAHSRTELPKGRHKLSCARKLIEIQYRLMLGGKEPYVLYADGTQVALSKALEKEGRAYADIAEWFPDIDPVKFKKKFTEKLEKEFKEKKVGPATDWLMKFHAKYRDTESFKYEPRDQAIPPAEILELLTKDSATINPFRLINEDGIDQLFETRIIDFNDLLIVHDEKGKRIGNTSAPDGVKATDDEGSYEVSSQQGSVDLIQYNGLRSLVEEYLDGRIGHDHTVHAWPDDAKVRAEMAPYYIEMVDAITWYLYWRQAMRDDEEVDSILSHQFLGVYTRHSLTKLEKAVIDNNAKAFKNKYRFLGARNFPGNPNFPGQAGKQLPDLERRSGNKGIKRDFVGNMMIARISTGDYSGLRKYNSYSFSMDQPLHQMVAKYLRPHEVAWIKRLEEVYEPLNFKDDKRSHNHIRNKIVAPLFAWENRLGLTTKLELLETERKAFAQKLSEIARDYLNDYQTWKSPYDKGVGQSDLFSDIERAVYEFSSTVRLDQDFERYLRPVLKDNLSNILVESKKPIDVNKVFIGIEYSFRSPKKFESRDEAHTFILLACDALKKHFAGGSCAKMDDGGHGHGLSLRYVFTDPSGKPWRVEWDGIRRSYRNGKAYHLRGGHVEIPTPKFAPQNMQDIEKLYTAMRSIEAIPKASAGGGHFNIDLAELFKLGDETGTEKFLNLLRYFESNREMIAFLWQHPAREKTSIPVELGMNEKRRLNEFKGNWKQLGETLYSIQYYNTFISRKPGYTQLNAVGLMSDAVPEEYKETIDIKNPDQQWFPSFGGKAGDRTEFRLFDAPENEVIAALQIKYVRALLNYVWNTDKKIPLETVFHPEHRALWEKDPKVFKRDMIIHLRQLGLKFDEFLPLFVQAWHNQQYIPFKDWREEKQFKKFKNRRIYVEEMRSE